MRRTFLHVVDGRASYVKLSPLMRALEERSGARQVLAHTGGSFDRQMSRAFFRDLGIREPDVSLELEAGSPASEIAGVMTAVEPVLADLAPDCLVVVGDASPALGAALVGSRSGVPVAHLEAGLRSGDRSAPEEVNRALMDRLATYLLVPTRGAAANLRREGIPGERIHVVGSITVDALEASRTRARELDVVGRFGLEPGAYALATLDRPANVDREERLAELLGAFDEIAAEVPLLFPVHPRTKDRMERFGLCLEETVLSPPVSYLEMVALMESAAAVLTDSGAIQEETTALGVPCLTLRDRTERPATVTEGTNRLVPDRSRDAVVTAFREALGDGAGRGEKSTRRPELWDGRTADRIADVLLEDGTTARG